MSTPQVAAWSDQRDEAIASFQNFPPAADEATLVEAFERSPAAVRHAFERTLDRWKNGTIRAPWRIWALECQRSRGDTVVATGPDRDKAAARAEQWMRAAGLMFDRWDEVDDELFGGLGRLRLWPDMRPRFEALWQELRPVGEHVEAEAEARAVKYLSDQQRIRDLAAARRQELDRLQEHDADPEPTPRPKAAA